MSSTLASAGALFFLLLALGGEAALGEMRWLFARLPHPRLLLGRVVELLEQRLNRTSRGRRSRLVRGGLVAVVVVALAFGAGLLVQWIAWAVPYLWPVELLIMMSLVAQRGPYMRAARAALLLSQGGLVAAQEALRPLVGAPPGELDKLDLQDTVQVGVAALARAFVHGVVAPCFWFALLGLPGLFLQQAVLVLSARFGGGIASDPRYRDFGMVAGRLHEVINFLPALLAGAMLACAAVFVPQGRPESALVATWRTFLRLEPAARLGSLGPAPAAMIAALGADREASHGWGAVELERARMLYIVGCLINAGLVAALALLILSV
jgi:adenosylcobinamide-phosphate synthase